MEDKSVMPSPIHSRAGDNSDSWPRHFNNYYQYKGYTEAK